MNYYFGIDGGGTKTQCYVGDEHGNILGKGQGGPCNYQTVGMIQAQKSIEEAFNEAIIHSDIKKEQLVSGILGLSGADEPKDFQILNTLCDNIFDDISYKVMNDTWIGLRTGSSFGVVSICGTGAGHAGKTRKGESYILRNLTYELGNRGGGGELYEKALHFAFRSNEGTYKKTRLEELLLRVFNVNNMDEVAHSIRTNMFTETMQFEIPVGVFKLAEEGDTVALEIIREMGYTEGLYARSVIQRLEMEHEAVPMVLIGSIFKTGFKPLIDAYLCAVHEVAPEAYPVIPTMDPVHGALLLAVERYT